MAPRWTTSALMSGEGGDVSEPSDGQPFGRWPLAQQDRSGWIGTLAKAAKADPRFPKDGSPDDARRRLSEMQAEGEMFEALDDAENEWTISGG